MVLIVVVDSGTTVVIDFGSNAEDVSEAHETDESMSILAIHLGLIRTQIIDTKRSTDEEAIRKCHGIT